MNQNPDPITLTYANIKHEQWNVNVPPTTIQPISAHLVLNMELHSVQFGMRVCERTTIAIEIKHHAQDRGRRCHPIGGQNATPHAPFTVCPLQPNQPKGHFYTALGACNPRNPAKPTHTRHRVVGGSMCALAR